MQKTKFKNTNNNLSYYQRVYSAVMKVPRGKVATYAEIAEIVNSAKKKAYEGKKITANMVGWALHANKSPEVPCHRVVNREGRLAPNFAFNGAKEQKIRLLSEGISFKGEWFVDLDIHLWQP